jgi:hypothetical protein
MIVQSEVMRRRVCEYLLRCSGDAGELLSLSDEMLDAKMMKFGTENSSNPAVVWLGYSPRDTRPPVRWMLVTDIDVETIMTKGLYPAWEGSLRSVGGKIARFVRKCAAAYGSEYDRTDLPPDDISYILGIVHPGRGDEVELIDGSHRLACLILHGVDRVKGFIGFRWIDIQPLP